MADCYRRKLTSKQVVELVEQHRAGMPLAALARNYGISPPAAAYHCRRAAPAREKLVEDKLRELSPILVDGWYGPGPYGFFLEAPLFRRPFLQALLLTNGAVAFDQTHSSSQPEPVERAETDIAEGVLEVTAVMDPTIANYLRDFGEENLRGRIRAHGPRIRAQIAHQLEGLWFVGAVMAA